MPEEKNLGQAAEDFLQLAGQFQSIFTMAEALKGFTSIEGAKKEREDALRRATTDHEAAKKALADTTAKLEATRGQISSELGAHQKNLAALKDRTMTEARAEAARITAAAQSDADAKTKAAADKIARETKTHEESMQDASDDLKTVTGQLADAKRDLAVAKSEYANLAKSAASLKAQLKQLAS